MAMGVKIRVWGPYALFSRPEMKVERCSYDVITPSAARGILEAVYWHPGLRWIVDRIYVKTQIRFTSVRLKKENCSSILGDNSVIFHFRWNKSANAGCVAVHNTILDR